MNRPLALILVAQLLLSLLYAWATPPFEASDEIWHYPVVRHIAETGQLPVQDVDAQAAWAQEGSQPPLYYLLGAALTAWIDTADYDEHAVLNPLAQAGVPGTTANANLVAHPPGQSPLRGGAMLAVYIIRLFSIALGLTTTYLIYRLALTIYPNRLAVALLAAAFAAFIPMALFIGASVNNDNLTVPLSTAVLWLLARDLKADDPGPRWRQTLLIGVLAGLGILTKISAAILLPTIALAVTLTAWRLQSWRNWLLRGVTLVAVVLVVGGWWYARNLLLYQELLGIQRMSVIAGSRPEGFGLVELAGEWSGFWLSFWGVFGGFNVLAPQWYYILASLLSLLSLAGLLLLFVRHIAKPAQDAPWRIHVVHLFFLAITLIGIMYWSLLTPASQGRLMFGGLGPIALYLSLGMLALIPARRRSLASLSLAAGLAICAALVAVTAIKPTYALPQAIPLLPADATPLDLHLGEHVRLIGYRQETPVVQAGDAAEITLFWTATDENSANQVLTLSLLGFEQEVVGKLAAWPGRGLWPTSYWQPGEIYPDTYHLPTRPDADVPTILKLDLALWDDYLVDEDELSARQAITADGQPLEFVFLDAGSLVSPLTETPSPHGEPLARFEHGITLQDYELQPTDSALQITLHWRTAPAPLDYTIFVHLVDESGNTVAQGDGPPRHGFWPTSRWRQDEAIRSTHIVTPPAELPPGPYRLMTGMYDPADGVRLPAFQPSGDTWQHNTILLETIKR